MKKNCIVTESSGYGENYLTLVNSKPYFVVSKARASIVSFSYAVRLVRKEMRYCKKKSLQRTYKIIIT